MATADEVELRVNLNTLKKTDTHIEEILDSAVQVALYLWKAEEERWEKPEVEGTLFVYSRKSAPFYGFTIMNRLSIENISEQLSPSMNFHKNPPFVLYKSGARGLPRGIWFYNQYDCSRIFTLVQKLQKESQQKQVSQIIAPVATKEKQPEKSVDIMDMLSKSYQEKRKNSAISPVESGDVPKTPGKKVDLNKLFNTFTPIKPESPVSQIGMTPTQTVTTPIDFTKTVALRNIMGISQKPPWPESDRVGMSSSDSSDDRLIDGAKHFQPTSVPETLAYEMKNMTMLETPPPGTTGLPKSESEGDIPNPNSFAILDSLEDGSDTGLGNGKAFTNLMQSPIGRPSDKIVKTISRNLFGSAQRNQTELLSPAAFVSNRSDRNSFSSSSSKSRKVSDELGMSQPSISKEALKCALIRLLEEDSDFLNRIHQSYQAALKLN